MTKLYQHVRSLRKLAAAHGLGPTCDGKRWTRERLKEKGVLP